MRLSLKGVLPVNNRTTTDNTFVGGCNGRAKHLSLLLSLALVLASFPLTSSVVSAAAATWTQLSPATSPPARVDAGMAFDSSTGQMILFGGQTVANGNLNDTWNWDGTTWTQLSPASSPSARYAASMAAYGGKIILFGGFGGTDQGDTWSWDGTTWTQLSPAISPPARSAATMALDATTGKLILFGGVKSGIYLNDTWSWDGTTWTQLSPTSSPTARYGAGMDFDTESGQLILFGGFNPSSSYLNDTWSWDGANWVQLAPATSPSGRQNISLAFDSSAEQLILFGGLNGSGYLNDTWSWDGTTWTQLSPSANPPVRGGANLAYDSATAQLILFGGFGGSQLNDTWSFTPATDTTPPTTTADASPYTFDSWTNQSVNVTLSATDDSSGVAHTYYILDSGSQTEYTGTQIAISAEGVHSLEFWTVDNASNEETHQTVTIKIDLTNPTVTYSGNLGSYQADQTVTITCSAADDLSGVATTTCADITGPAYSFGLGSHTFSATATDNAGNVGSGEVTFTVVVTVDSLKKLTAQFESNPFVNAQLQSELNYVQRFGYGPLKSLFVNLYVVSVKMQRGRTLTGEQADTLITLARAL